MTQKTAQVTSDSLGLKTKTQFLQSGSTDGSSDPVSHTSFRHLIGLAAGSVMTDLLNILSKIGGFGLSQNKQSGASADLIDQTKHGTGYVSTDHTVKTALKDLLKPHE